MKQIERNTEVSSLRTGVLTTFRACVGRRGADRSPSSIQVALRRGLVLTLLVLPAAALVVTLATAFAASPPQIRSVLYEEEIFPTRVNIVASVATQGQALKWRAEYVASSATCKPAGVETGCGWIGAGSEITGISPVELIGVGTDFMAGHKPILQHLKPQTSYYVRFFVENSEKQTAEKTIEFTTPAISKPEITEGKLNQKNRGEGVKILVFGRRSALLIAPIQTNGADTEYHFEYSLSEAGPWTSFNSGLVTAVEDFASPGPEAGVSGLAPETQYYARVRLVNHCNESKPTEECVAEEIAPFKTLTARPVVFTPEVSKVTATSVDVADLINPGGSETNWRYEYATSESGPWTNATGAGVAGTVSQAEAETTPESGPYLKIEAKIDVPAGVEHQIYYVRLFAENEAGEGQNFLGEPISGETHNFVGFEAAGPPTAKAFAVHAIHGEFPRVLGSINPYGVDTHYQVEYVSQEQFEKEGFLNPEVTLQLDLGAGSSHVEELPGRVRTLVYDPRLVGVDLAGLQPRERYWYRIRATNASPGNPVVHSMEQSLTVPSVPTGEAPADCPNEGHLSGASARLPDCRAYEQLTPVDKEGSQEMFKYGGSTTEGMLVGEDGEHAMFEAPFVKWGAGVGAGQSPYLFSRNATSGWQTTAVSAEPEAGVNRYSAQIFSPDLTQLGLEVGWNIAKSSESPTIEFKVGPSGGPYTALATVPRAQVGENGGWVAASPDFSKLILQVGDHSVCGQSTGTSTGYDLYEYVEGQCRQVNTLTNGTKIGSCGATIVHGDEGRSLASSRHAVSADGSRVFFEEVPGTNCSQPKHLYMRSDGSETRDLGVYTFLGADAQGHRVLVESGAGETHEVSLYNTESSTVALLFSERQNPQLLVSEDFTAIYLTSREQIVGTEAPAVTPEVGLTAEDLYRYDISTETLRYLVQAAKARVYSSSPDGRYLYFTADVVGGLPGGGPELEAPHAANVGQTHQVYSYDSAEAAVECMSCASPFDSEPRLDALFTENSNEGVANTKQGMPKTSIASANGDYVFFQTPAALISADVDGEVAPELPKQNGGEHGSGMASLSSDVYEWRRAGVDGCAHIQGCLSLITSGRGGFLNLFLGTTDSGRDVFFYTGESLLRSDADTAGDIYDARIGGGFPIPPALPECDGDSCSRPFVPPVDVTPGSFTFEGAGNVPGEVRPQGKAKPKPKKKKTRKKTKSKKKSKHGKSARTRHTPHGRGAK